ncbi:MAG: phosphate acetyltransferase [Bacteroidetes bacterium]|nr:MAG: phosphate acetyltransferase [Bacteroidota bacterium]
MSKNLYITATEAFTGKSMITLGLMEILSNKTKNIGFFRPVVLSGKVMDNNIKLISSGYNLNLKYEEMYGLTNDEMLGFHQTGDINGMYSAILEKYKQLEKKCDFILIEGSDYQSHLSTYEFGFNLDIANNLGCPIISIVNGLDKSISQITESIQIMKQILHQKKCTQVGMIVNRADSNEITNIEQILLNTLPNNELGCAIPEDKKQITNPLNFFKTNVNTQKLGDKIMSIKSEVITPIMFEYVLFNRAKQNRKHIVLPEGNDDRVLKAANKLLKRNIVDITILGIKEEISSRAKELNIRIENAVVIDPKSNSFLADYAEEYFNLRKHKGISLEAATETMRDVSYFGTMMVHKGDADGMVSGAAHTTQHTIRPAFEFIKTKPGISIVSSSFFMCLEDRVLVYGDCAVNPNPDAEQLADIAISSAQTALMFNIEPRIAMLSYSTGVSGKGPEVEKVRKATEIVKKNKPELKVEGPIQYDAAVDAAVAKTKMPDSQVAGKATVFIFPDLNTGNITYKAVQRSANALAIGPVLQGLNKPVNDLSRGCLVEDIVNTVVITAIQAQED